MCSVDLSVVIITKNEEQNIGSSIKSVLGAVQKAKEKRVISKAEIILVDSASIDRTVEIAKQFPVRIVELNEKWPLSAAAGIYSGYRVSVGTFFAVVDGDVEVDLYWFSDGLPYLRDDKEVGCVYGWWEEGSKGKGFLFQSVMQQLNTLKISQPKEVDFVGNGIFRKMALDQVGGHNPYLKGAEDKDVSFRLRLAGYKLLLVPVQFGIHYWHFSILEYYRSIRGWSIGEGHAAAYARKNGNEALFNYFIENYSGNVLWRCFRHVVLLFFLLITLGLTLSGVKWGGYSLFVVGFIFVLVLIRARKWDDSHSLEFIFNYFNRLPYTFYRHWYFHKGLKLETPDPVTYPSHSSSNIN